VKQLKVSDALNKRTFEIKSIENQGLAGMERLWRACGGSFH
jgi:hypothetical protein